MIHIIIILLLACFLSVIFHKTSVESFTKIDLDTQMKLGTNVVSNLQNTNMTFKADYDVGIDNNLKEEREILKEFMDTKKEAEQLGEVELRQAGIDGIESLGDLVPYLTYEQHRKIHYYKRKHNFENLTKEKTEKKPTNECVPYCPKNMYDIEPLNYYKNILYTYNNVLGENKNTSLQRNMKLINGILDSQKEFLDEEKNALESILENKK